VLTQRQYREARGFDRVLIAAISPSSGSFLIRYQGSMKVCRSKPYVHTKTSPAVLLGAYAIRT
jgi:hypothetical protein